MNEMYKILLIAIAPTATAFLFAYILGSSIFRNKRKRRDDFVKAILPALLDVRLDVEYSKCIRKAIELADFTISELDKKNEEEV